MIDSKEISVGDHLEFTEDCHTFMSDFKKGDILLVLNIEKNVRMVDDDYEAPNNTFTKDVYTLMTEKNQYLMFTDNARVFNKLKRIDLDD